MNTRQPEEPNFRWNFAVNIVDISFFGLALAMVSLTTILPLLISRLTPSKLAIGLVSTIFSLGYLLPQLLVAGYTESLRRKKPFVVLVSGIGERVPYLCIGICVWLFAERAPGLALGAIYLLLAVSAISGGVATPAWYDLIAKVIPLSYRGLWSGLGWGLGAFMGIAGSALAGYFLEKWPFPQNYALCFLAAFCSLVISFFGLVLNREPDSPVVKQHQGLLNYLRKLPQVLRGNRNYRLFLITRSVVSLGSMAGGFFIVYGAQQFGVAGEQVGALTAMLVGSQTLWNLLWGLLGDRKGHKLVLVGAAFAMATANLAALVVPSATVLWGIFFLLGAAMAGEITSGLNIILEFCAPEDRPTYIGLTNTLLAPIRALAPILGGWLATWLGYPPLFLVAFLISVAGAMLLGLWVREPRHLPQMGSLEMP